jgi:hypothetical protein
MEDAFRAGRRFVRRILPAGQFGFAEVSKK